MTKELQAQVTELELENSKLKDENKFLVEKINAAVSLTNNVSSTYSTFIADRHKVGGGVSSFEKDTLSKITQGVMGEFNDKFVKKK